MYYVECIKFLVNTITHILVMYLTYEFINGVVIPYLTHWTYAQIDVAFSNHIQSFKVM